MHVDHAIRTRRTIKDLRDEPVAAATVRELLELAVQAPNHHLTEPWRFWVLGPATIELRFLTDDSAATKEAIEQFVTALHDIFGSLNIAAVRLTELRRERNGKFRPVIGWSGNAA